MKRQVIHLCVFTGASSGIGEATALEFAREGAKVALNSRTEEKLKKTAAKCQEAGAKEQDVRIQINFNGLNGQKLGQSGRHSRSSAQC